MVCLPDLIRKGTSSLLTQKETKRDNACYIFSFMPIVCKIHASELCTHLFLVMIWLKETKNLFRVFVCMHAHVSLCVWVSSVLRVKRSESELIQHETFHASFKFKSILEKGADLNFSGMEVPAFWVS